MFGRLAPILRRMTQSLAWSLLLCSLGSSSVLGSPSAVGRAEMELEPIQRPRAAFLTSFGDLTYEDRTPLRRFLSDLIGEDFFPNPRRVEEPFRATFESLGYDVVFVHDANASQLWEELIRPENKVVFWLSHGVRISGQARVSVTDKGGHDVTSVFQAAHSGLLYLGVIACQAAESVAKELRLRQESLPTTARDLRVGSFSNSPTVMRGLRQLLADAQSAPSVRAARVIGPSSTLAGERGASDNSDGGNPSGDLRITRSRVLGLSEDDSIQVFLGPRLVGVFPPFRNGEATQSLVIPGGRTLDPRGNPYPVLTFSPRRLPIQEGERRISASRLIGPLEVELVGAVNASAVQWVRAQTRLVSSGEALMDEAVHFQREER